jgi:REP-associated tyrosine transposase
VCDFPGTLYYLVYHSNNNNMTFIDDRDYQKFLYYLEKYILLFNMKVHSYCLLPEHFYLLVENGKRETLIEMTRRLLTAYSIWFNRKHDRHGHLFRQCSKKIIVEKPDFMVSVSHYIHKIVITMAGQENPEIYNWSSLRYYINGGEPPWLCTHEILSRFNGSRKKYLQFIRKESENGLKPVVKSYCFIGCENFVRYWNKETNKFKNQTSFPKKKKDNKKAERFIYAVAEKFQISPEELLNHKGSHKKAGDARVILINLLVDHLLWEFSETANFLNMKNHSNISYHIKKLKNETSLQKKYMEITNNLNKEPVI